MNARVERFGPDVARAVEPMIAEISRRVGHGFEGAVSVGLMGSVSRGDATSVSDIDCYAVFDVGELTSLGSLVHQYSLESIVADATANSAHLSLFWSSVEQLATGRYDLGRFPAYDRAAFIRQRTHLAGRPSSAVEVRSPSRLQVLREGAEFSLSVLRPRVERSGLLSDPSATRVQNITANAPEVISKSILMPVRLLYTTLQTGELVVSPEVAVAECSRHYGNKSWWPLADVAVRWRHHPPTGTEHADQVAQSIARHLRPLYRDFTEAYASIMSRLDCENLAGRLRRWKLELSTDNA